MPRTAPSPTRRIAAPALSLLALLLLLGAPATAHAGDCDTCPTPGATELAAAGVVLEMRYSEFPRDWAEDYAEIDAGECSGKLAGPPELTRDASYLVLRGEGEVWDCPHSKSVDTVTVTTSETDSTSWTVTAKVSAKVKALAGEVTAEIGAGRTTGTSITEVTAISKQIAPGWCHRIQWKGWFEVGTFRANAEFRYTQRWAYWTKNRLTGDKVHQKGDVYVDCGSTQVELTRKAPVAGYFELAQSGCGEGCGPIAPRYLGFFPELPERLRPKTDSEGGCEADDDAPQEEPAGNDPAGDEPSDDPDGGDPEGDPDPEEAPASGDLPPPPGGEDAPADEPAPEPLPDDGR